MIFRNNPVLQNELIANLRRPLAFALLLAYVGLLILVTLYAWPDTSTVDLNNPEKARRLVNLFFLGQYVLASLMTPAFASGAISGERERKSYEMLLASPLTPYSIVLGKFLASLVYVLILVFASLPIVLICLPLGGTNLAEILSLYWVLFTTVACFTMISLACSGRFQRSAASLATSYLLILPLALLGLWLWSGLEAHPEKRLILSTIVVPLGQLVLMAILLARTSFGLLYPADIGSEGSPVIDEQEENRQAVGMVIRRDEFPDRLFAPPKRTDLLEDGANPVFDKEMRSELFSQGTLMLRLVIQLSMGLALPVMAVCLFIRPDLSHWYFIYMLLFVMLVVPVFSAGAFTSERQRQTLDLLLVTTLSPWTILWGKLLSSLRVSGVLTSFLFWPVVLATIMNSYFWGNLWTLLLGVVAIVLACVVAAEIAVICSIFSRRTSQAMISAYLLIGILFLLPPALQNLVGTFGTPDEVTLVAKQAFLSPFAAILSLPLQGEVQLRDHPANWPRWWTFVGSYLGLGIVLAGMMAALVKRRWLVAEG